METINDYVYRGLRPRPMPAPTPKQISTPAGQRLSTILESSSVGGGNNNHTGKAAGFNLANLAASRSARYGAPPRPSHEVAPPIYASQDFHKPPPTDPSEPVSDSRFARLRHSRGGWKRLAVIVVVAILLIAVALGVGLGVGLKNSTNSSSSAPSSTSAGFPVGTYTIAAFLVNQTTSCASNNLTWACYPYTLYSAGSTASEVPFNWIISTSQTNSSAYQISSANNPLSILFANATLSLVDENLSTERYTFSVPNTVKNVVPSASLSGDNIRSTCFFNSTTFQASLYTRLNATFTDASFNTTWPGAVKVEQVASGGSDVPNCYHLSNGYASGSQIPLATESGEEQCSCVYSNYDVS